MHRILTTGIAVFACLAISGSVALANDCVNVSRPAPTGNQPTQTGNWIWLPSLFPTAPPIWAFAVPGGQFSDVPGNFRNLSVTGIDSVLEGTGACNNANRQTTKGIQNHLCQ